MKVIVTGILSLFAVTASAGGLDCRSGVDHKHPGCFSAPNIVVQHVHHGHRHWNHHRHAPVIIHRHNYDWVAHVIGGVIIGAAINEISRPHVVERPVVIQPSTNAVSCTEWREIQQPDGTIARERTCYQR